MTCWYAPASAWAVEQFGPSLLPCQPPKDGTMSPPAERIALIVCWSTPPVSGRFESHAGLQPPPESTTAIVNRRMPVADRTVLGAGGPPQPRYMYGAPRPPDGWV